MAATQVITVSVYGVEAALVTVRLLAGSRAGSTFGHSPVNSAATTATTAMALAVNAHPSRPRNGATTAPVRPSATSATAAHHAGLPPPPGASRNAITTPIVTGARL